MGFVQNDDGKWVKKGVVIARNEFSREPHLSQHKDSIAEIKAEQRKLSKNMEKIATSMKLGFEDIKKLHVVHTTRFGALDKEIRGLKHQVNNSIHVTRNVFPYSVDEFASTSTELQASVKSSAEDVVKATEVHMEVDRNLRPHGMKWTY
ncbi:hypothetical protein CJ030_MR3G009551 [Morella rubra]|uniref:Uncharacterized protein n=1 Tax=Morella rubra TaxID=262757 RepID=A0A6A1W3T7_9ROSI|nr:hypothetical protein CJ030_MR3G009551 [Morella rubra]